MTLADKRKRTPAGKSWRSFFCDQGWINRMVKQFSRAASRSEEAELARLFDGIELALCNDASAQR
jgi:hypothetical protein